ncbi:MAG: glycosyltransferase [Sediminibacterium sp.]|nr:glycosyltransferase [Sediminibacterium sp.]
MAKNFNIQKVLVAPLDWGLGHATRDILIIRALMAKGYEVIIGSEGAQASLLHAEFPSLQILPLPGYQVQYSKTQWGFLFTILFQIPRIYRVIKAEHRWLAKVIDEHRINLVISDNRFGLHAKKIPCIFITHQLTVKAPFNWLENLMQKVNYHFINQFNACWVPDVAGEENVAGVLSHPVILPKPTVHYIGLLARFQRQEAIKKYDYCILLSGPEPQRTLLEEKILAGIAAIDGKIVLVRGKPGSKEVLTVPENVTVNNHLPTHELQRAILQSDYIVCRGGYTSLMELLSLQKKMLLIPTPGQTEQEYLAKRLMDLHICFSVTQHRLNCAEHFAMVKKYPYQLPKFSLFKEEMITTLLGN